MLNMQVLQRQHQQLQHASADPQRLLALGSSGGTGKPAGLPAAGVADDAAVVVALLKYKFYKQFGIDPQHVAPYREEWLQKALALVPVSPPPHVSQVCVYLHAAGPSRARALRDTCSCQHRPQPHTHSLRCAALRFMPCIAAAVLSVCLLQEYYDHIVTSSIEEAHEDYATSMKQAILDYVLANPLERQRLGLDGLWPLLVPHMPAQQVAAAAADHSSSSADVAVLGPPLVPASHAALVQRQLPAEWRQRVAMAR
jgi:hypothetical protein